MIFDRRTALEPGIPLGLRRSELSAPVPEHLSALGEEMATGAEWEAAYRRFLVRITDEESVAGHWPPPDGRLNWIWLTDLGPLTSAVDLASPFGDLAQDLMREVEPESGRVTYLAAPSPHTDIVRSRLSSVGDRVKVVTTGDASDLPSPASVDCVFFVASEGWEARLPGFLGGARGIADFAQSVLRPGGWLIGVLENPVALIRARPSPKNVLEFARAAAVRRELSRGVQANGFREARWYHAAPSISAQVLMIPADPVAYSGWSETQGSAGSGGPSRLRSYLRRFMFPITTIMAQV